MRYLELEKLSDYGNTEYETTAKTIAEIDPYDKRIDVVFRIISKGEVREVLNKRSQENHSVCDITVGDSSASIILTLWNEDIDAVSVDSTYRIKNGYINIFNNSMRLAKGKYGQLESVEGSDEISDVNADKNRSDEEHQRQYRERRPSRGFGGGGGGDRRSGGWDDNRGRNRRNRW